MPPQNTFITFNSHEARAADALFERLFPADIETVGASAIGVVDYVDRSLAGAYAHQREAYRLGLAALDRAAQAQHAASFADCAEVAQDQLVAQLAEGTLPHFEQETQRAFFQMLRAHLQEGLFADPIYGGNRDKLGWRVLGHPGVWMENSAAENLSAEPVTKGGMIQSLADLNFEADDELAGLDPHRGGTPPAQNVDVVLVGLGSMGALIAARFAEAGLKVVALEAGPWRTRRDFLPDELGAAYYCRANMGPKFAQETPTWRRNVGEPTQEATFSLGRMMNSVGGSVLHYGAWLRRFHPHHFHPRSWVDERWGAEILPADCTLADWPVSYAELEPYYVELEHLIGVAGDESNPFVARSRPLPMPPLRPFRMGQMFAEVTRSMGLHPHPVAVGVNSVPYDGRPAITYTAWANGFGDFNGSKWTPDRLLPRALATGNLDLRTNCRVLRVLTERDGRASGVEYVDANGKLQVQKAPRVILASYTFENVRLLLLSGDASHPEGLGNNRGQVGKHFMTKMFAHVDGFFPETVFNRHTGPASQGIVLDDYLAENFDSWAHGFVGCATLGAEQQFLPIQISREALPSDTPSWGAAYKEHLRSWQHLGVVRIQPDTLPYSTNFLDLDPVRRDRSGLGLPLVRITYDMRANEQRLADWMEGRSEEILRAMGASNTWRGPRFTGVGSSHDLGGCRMGDDPSQAVLNRSLEVHDTPGLYVFSGAALPSCPGINPTLTMWALCLHAADALIGQ